MLPVTVPAVAVKVAVVESAGTVTEAGTVKAAVLLVDNVTTVPEAGAAAVNVTVQLVVEPELTVVGVQPIADGVTDAAVSPRLKVFSTPL